MYYLNYDQCYFDKTVVWYNIYKFYEIINNTKKSNLKINSKNILNWFLSVYFYIISFNANILFNNNIKCSAKGTSTILVVNLWFRVYLNIIELGHCNECINFIQS